MKKGYLYIFIILLLSVIPLFDLSHPGIPVTHDGIDHVARIANFYQSLHEGKAIPRWAQNLNWGYGHPILMFLYPLPSYLVSLVHLFNFSLVDSFKIVSALVFVASALTMYVWVREFTDDTSAFFASALYVYAPYRFVDLYVRGAIGEHVAFVFPPLLLYCILKISKTRKSRYTALGALSLAGFILAHNAISLMFLPVVFLYALYLFFQTGKQSRFSFFISWLEMVLLGFGLSACFWIPAFFEGKYTLRDIVTSNDYTSRFVHFLNFFYGKWDYGGTGKFTVQIGIVQWLVVFISFPILWLSNKRKEKNAIVILGMLVIFFFSLFLMTLPSLFIWKTITILQKFQFPWRLLSLSVFSSSVLGGLVCYFSPKTLRGIVVAVFMILLLYSQKDYWHAKSYEVKSEAFYTGIYQGTTDTGESAPIWSVRFMEHVPNEDMEIISGNATIKKVSRISTRHEYIVSAEEDSRLRENTLYFPGWNVYDNGQKALVEFQDPSNRGLMTFFVTKGIHSIRVEFEETKLRLVSDIISLGFLVMVGFIFFFSPRIWRIFR